MHCIRSFFWTLFSWNRTEKGYLPYKSPYSVWIREKTDQNLTQMWTFSMHIWFNERNKKFWPNANFHKLNFDFWIIISDYRIVSDYSQYFSLQQILFQRFCFFTYFTEASPTLWNQLNFKDNFASYKRQTDVLTMVRWRPCTTFFAHPFTTSLVRRWN